MQERSRASHLRAVRRFPDSVDFCVGSGCCFHRRKHWLVSMRMGVVIKVCMLCSCNSTPQADESEAQPSGLLGRPPFPTEGPSLCLPQFRGSLSLLPSVVHCLPPSPTLFILLWAEVFHANRNQNRARVTILTLGKMNFKMKTAKR